MPIPGPEHPFRRYEIEDGEQRERETQFNWLFAKVVKASSLLSSVLECSQQYDEWEDRRGYKCSPPHLPPLPGEHTTTVLDQIRQSLHLLSMPSIVLT